MNAIKDLHQEFGTDRSFLVKQLGIPYRTVQDWELGNRETPQWVMDLLRFRLTYNNLGGVKMKISNVELAKMAAERGYDYNEALDGIDAGRTPENEAEDITLEAALELVENVCSSFAQEADC